MALVLSLKTNEDFFVGDRRFVVDDVFAEDHFTLRDEHTGKQHDIRGSHATEVLKDVFVSAGDQVQSTLARVAIEAPRSIMVLRGENYRNPPAHARKPVHA